MASRSWPGKLFGRLPELDKYIKRGDDKNPGGRWKVGKQSFPNLTEARQHVATTRNIEIDVPFSDVEYIPGSKYTVARPSLKSRRKKPQLPIPAAEPIVAVPLQPKYGLDILTPAGHQIHVSCSTAEDVGALVRELEKK